MSRKDPAYVGKAKEVQEAEKAREEGKCPGEVVLEVGKALEQVKVVYPDVNSENTGIGSTIFAVKPGDG